MGGNEELPVPGSDVSGCDCDDCAKIRKRRKREEAQKERQREYERWVKTYGSPNWNPDGDFVLKTKKMPNQIPYGYMGGYDSGDNQGTWLGFDRTKVPEFKAVKEESKMPVFKVLVTRTLSKPQPDGSLLPVEQLVSSSEVVARDSAVAIFIAGTNVSADEVGDLSLAQVKAIQQ